VNPTAIANLGGFFCFSLGGSEGLGLRLGIGLLLAVGYGEPWGAMGRLFVRHVSMD